MSKAQLFCFTHAGGTMSFFDDLEKDFHEIEVQKFEYSGHGTRHKKPHYKTFEELADDACKFIQMNIADVHYALLGYSMGLSP